jgi:hypothetical protein
LCSVGGWEDELWALTCLADAGLRLISAFARLETDVACRYGLSSRSPETRLQLRGCCMPRIVVVWDEVRKEEVA